MGASLASTLVIETRCMTSFVRRKHREEFGGFLIPPGPLIGQPDRRRQCEASQRRGNCSDRRAL